MTQFYLRKLKPVFLGYLTKLIYKSENISIGKDFKCDGIPRILIDKDAKLSIGNGVEFRSGVEIRVHGTSKILISDHVRIDRGVRLLSANKSTVKIGEKSRVSLYTVMNGGDDITIGKKVLISGFVYLQTSMHKFSDPKKPIQEQGYFHGPIILEDDVWLGAHVTVMPEVKICKGSIVGSNAVVTKTINSYKVFGGIPAKELKIR